MEESTLKALKGSIRKWWHIAYSDGQDGGVMNCALCLEFYNFPIDCYSCPVQEATGYPFCENSPYSEWDAFSHEERSWYKEDGTYHYPSAVKEFPKERQEKAKKLAIAELDFLVSLLPPGESWEDPEGWVWYSDRRE